MPSLIDYYPVELGSLGELPSLINPPTSNSGGIQSYATISLKKFEDWGELSDVTYKVTLLVNVIVPQLPTGTGPATVGGIVGPNWLVDLSTYNVSLSFDNQFSEFGIISYELTKDAVTQSELDDINSAINEGAIYQIDVEYKGQTYPSVLASLLAGKGDIATLCNALMTVKQIDTSGAGLYVCVLSVTDFPKTVPSGNTAIAELKCFADTNSPVFGGPLPGVVVVADNLGTSNIQGEPPSSKSVKMLTVLLETNNAGLVATTGFNAIVTGSASKIWGYIKLVSGETIDFVGSAMPPTA